MPSNPFELSMLIIRSATANDAATIKKMIRNARLDPTFLKWKNFLVAEYKQEVVGIGQIKPYPGCRELGSLVVSRKYQNKGIGAKLIEALESQTEFPIYLLCHNKMELVLSKVWI